jgi:hypothetical protein
MTMKTKNFLVFLGVIFMTILACEDVIQLKDEVAVTDKSLIDSQVNPADSTVLPPPDTTGNNDTIPSDTIVIPGYGPDCDSIGSLWICGVDDPNAFDYSLLIGVWQLRVELIRPDYPNEPTDEYFDEAYAHYLTFNDDNTFSEVFEGTTIQSGTWQSYPDKNNQVCLVNTSGKTTVYYLLSLNYVLTNNELVDYYTLQMATLDKEREAIIDRQFKR